jgi:hypothetical protein
VVGATEGAATRMDALDSQTLWSAAGSREGVAEDQCATDRSAESGQDTPAATDLRAYQAGLSAEAPYSGEDRSLGCAVPVSRKSIWCGNSASGEFGPTLNVTDIHMIWTESGAVLEKTLAPRAWKSKSDFHFPTDTATTEVLRLHFKCLDNHR